MRGKGVNKNGEVERWRGGEMFRLEMIVGKDIIWVTIIPETDP